MFHRYFTWVWLHETGVHFQSVSNIIIIIIIYKYICTSLEIRKHWNTYIYTLCLRKKNYFRHLSAPGLQTTKLCFSFLSLECLLCVASLASNRFIGWTQFGWKISLNFYVNLGIFFSLHFTSHHRHWKLTAFDKN